MNKTMASIVSLEKIEVIRSQEFMPSAARLKLKKKKIILGPKTAILGPQFCRILVLGLIFGAWGGRAPRAPLDPPLNMIDNTVMGGGGETCGHARRPLFFDWF